jgi:hypothetical protein
MTNSQEIEKLGKQLYCIHCGLNYDEQRKRVAEIECINEWTTHEYKVRERLDDCPRCGVTMEKISDWDCSTYLSCSTCNHQEPFVRVEELDEDE